MKEHWLSQGEKGKIALHSESVSGQSNILVENEQTEKNVYI